jgi:branched-chain amino acid transport system permease protein
LLWTLNRTKVGLLVRAGVQDREMVESLGYRIQRLFVGVFVAGSALAGLGGVMWGLVQQNVTPQIGAQVNVLIFIVIIIGGLGSTLGCFVGALLVGLMANYTGFLAPKVALFSNIGLMVAILLWRPQGLYPVTNR